MSKIIEILSVMSEERNKNPVQSPACEAAELRILGMLAERATEKIQTKVSQTIVRTANEKSKYSGATILKKEKPFGLGTALVTNASNASLEGMILHVKTSPFTRTTTRPYYAYARYTIFTLEEFQLKKNLDELNLKYPDGSSNALTTLLGLLALCEVSVGRHFEQNIYDFSDWMMSEKRHQVMKNWGYLGS